MTITASSLTANVVSGIRVIVTGGAGFIGSAVCRLFVGEFGATILNIDKLTYAANPQLLKPVADDPRYRFRRADILDRKLIAELLRDFAPDAILHLAAAISAGGCFIRSKPGCATRRLVSRQSLVVGADLVRALSRRQARHPGPVVPRSAAG